MSNDDDFINRLEDYLEVFDGSTPLPDRVRDAIRAELPSARQVRPRPGFMRVFTMLSNAPVGARLGLAAAAIIAVVILGAAVLNNRDEGLVGAPPAVTTNPTQPATASPSVGAVPQMLGDAPYVACDPADTAKSCLAAGTYRLTGGSEVWPVPVTIDVPPGWFGWEANTGYDGVLKSGNPPTHGDTGWGVMFSSVGDVARDPCNTAKGMIPAAQVDTPQKLAAAMAAWPQFEATAAQPVTIDGHSGLRLQLTSTAPSGCDLTGNLWQTVSGGAMDVYPMVGPGGPDERAPGTFEIVDTGHGLLVIRWTDFPQTSPFEIQTGSSPDPTAHAGDQAELHAILDSIRLTVPPTSP